LLDSLGSYHVRSKIVNHLKNFLRMELERSGRDATFHESEVEVLRPKVPQQSNGSDCGVFVLEYAERFLTTYFEALEVCSDVIADALDNVLHPTMFGDAEISAKRREMKKQIMEAASPIEAEISREEDLLESSRASVLMEVSPREGEPATEESPVEEITSKAEEEEGENLSEREGGLIETVSKETERPLLLKEGSCEEVEENSQRVVSYPLSEGESDSGRGGGGDTKEMGMKAKRSMKVERSESEDAISDVNEEIPVIKIKPGRKRLRKG
jgi:hypothetical protein